MIVLICNICKGQLSDYREGQFYCPGCETLIGLHQTAILVVKENPNFILIAEDSENGNENKSNLG